jgi:hypothetical protein
MSRLFQLLIVLVSAAAAAAALNPVQKHCGQENKMCTLFFTNQRRCISYSGKLFIVQFNLREREQLFDNFLQLFDNFVTTFCYFLTTFWKLFEYFCNFCNFLKTFCNLLQLFCNFLTTFFDNFFKIFLQLFATFNTVNQFEQAFWYGVRRTKLSAWYVLDLGVLG